MCLKCDYILSVIKGIEKLVYTIYSCDRGNIVWKLHGKLSNIAEIKVISSINKCVMFSEVVEWVFSGRVLELFKLNNVKTLIQSKSDMFLDFKSFKIT